MIHPCQFLIEEVWYPTPTEKGDDTFLWITTV